jgi:hypothetical protein
MKKPYLTMTLKKAKKLLRLGKIPKNPHVRDLLNTMRKMGVK